MRASDFLRQAAEVIEQRGTLRDKPDGERSMERAVDAYITLNGPNLQGELDGWLFLCVLKLARATAGGAPHLDDYTDLAGYAALAAECVQREADAEDEYESAIGHYLDSRGVDPEAGAVSPPSAAAGCDTLGRADPKAPLDMSAFTKETPLTDRLYGREEEEGEPIYGEPSCYGDRIILGYKPKPSNDGWIEWKGGDCPVKEDARLDLLFRGDDKCYCTDVTAVTGLRWSHNGTPGDIVKYRIKGGN